MTLEDRLSRLETQYQDLADAIEQFAKDLENLGVGLGQALRGIQPAKPKAEQLDPRTGVVPETTFSNLKYVVVQSDKMGEFEIAAKSENSENFASDWQRAYNVLVNAKSEIKSRYHGPGYTYSYWLFGEGKIYRQRLKETKA